MTPAQCRAARALLDITQPQLARAAGLSLSTVVDFERSRRQVSEEAIASIRHALEAEVEFTNGDQPGVKARQREADKSDKQALPEGFQRQVYPTPSKRARDQS
jgi:transcriptional regulator with XRE-family HTH domain